MNAPPVQCHCRAPTCSLQHSITVLMLVILAMNVAVLILCDVRKRRIIMAIPEQDIMSAYYSRGDRPEWQISPPELLHAPPDTVPSPV